MAGARRAPGRPRDRRARGAGYAARRARAGAEHAGEHHAGARGLRRQAARETKPRRRPATGHAHGVEGDRRAQPRCGLGPLAAQAALAFNRGAAFSFLAGADGWQRWLFTAIAIAASVFIVWLLRRGGSRLYLLGLALILGGALGNLVDRLWLGQVVDFVLLHWRGWSYPAFNLADSAITAGAALLIVDSFRQRRADAPAAP
jgi:signal peptidase II